MSNHGNTETHEVIGGNSTGPMGEVGQMWPDGDEIFQIDLLFDQEAGLYGRNPM